MGKFFKTLFTWNAANVGKFIVGAAQTILVTESLTPGDSFPSLLKLIAALIVGAGTTLGIHLAHTVEPPIIPPRV